MELMSVVRHLDHQVLQLENEINYLDHTISHVKAHQFELIEEKGFRDHILGGIFGDKDLKKREKHTKKYLKALYQEKLNRRVQISELRAQLTREINNWLSTHSDEYRKNDELTKSALDFVCDGQKCIREYRKHLAHKKKYKNIEDLYSDLQSELKVLTAQARQVAKRFPDNPSLYRNLMFVEDSLLPAHLEADQKIEFISQLLNSFDQIVFSYIQALGQVKAKNTKSICQTKNLCLGLDYEKYFTPIHL